MKSVTSKYGSLCLLLLNASACHSGPPPEPAPRKAEPVAAAAKTAEPTPAPPTPPPAETAAPKPAEVAAAPGDPVHGKFTMEDATKGLAGTGKLFAEMKTDKGAMKCELWPDKA